MPSRIYQPPCATALQGDTAAATFVASYDVEEVADAPASAVDRLPANGSGLNSHSPFLATVSEVRELHTGGERSCVHVELDIRGCKATYEAGAQGSRVCSQNNMG